MSDIIQERRVNTSATTLPKDTITVNKSVDNNIIPLRANAPVNTFESVLTLDFTPKLQQVGTGNRLSANTFPNPNKTATLEERLVKPLIPDITNDEKINILNAFDNALIKIRKESANIRRLNNIAHLDPDKTDEKLLSLKLFDSGVSEYDKRMTFFIADAFRDVDNNSKDSNSVRLETVANLLKDLRQDVEKHDTAQRKEAKRPLIAVIDDFEGEKLVDINRDGRPDFEHGNLVVEVMKAKNKNIDVVPFNASSGEVRGSIDMQDVTDELERVLRFIRRGYQFDGLNMSFGGNIPVEVKDKNGQSLNIADLDRETLLNIFWTVGLVTKNGGTDFVRHIDVVERIAKTTPVYIAAGNAGKDFFCPYGLAKSPNVHIVGATDSKGNKTEYSANNKFITDWAQGSYKIREINAGKTSGYDINEDNVIDITKNDPRLTQGPKVNKGFWSSLFQDDEKSFHGTSFSSPAALMDSINKKARR